MSGAVELFELRIAGSTTRCVYGPGAIAAGAEELEERLAGRALFVVSSRPVLDLHSGALEPLISRAASCATFEIPDGEAAKTLGVADGLWRALVDGGGLRDSVVVGFGGGSVTDLAGFVAGAFLRGVDWVAVPTTLLGQVDAAIGGKTAVDLPAAKNAVGLFHHPLAVLAEAGVLGTLTGDLRRAGLVEAIKTAVVLDGGLLERIEQDLDGLLAGDASGCAAVAASAAAAKARLVERDPGEVGPRQLVNFGHTLGHALEAEIGYGRIAHGDAVAHGMRFALELSRSQGASSAFVERVRALIDRLAVPPLPGLSVAALMRRVSSDKKARARGLGWVLAAAPGEGRFGVRLPPEEVEKALERFLSHPASRSL